MMKVTAELGRPHPRIAASIENGDPVISTKWPNRGPYQGIDALLFRPLADAFGRKRMLFERTLATVRRRRLQVCSMGPFSSGHYPYASQRTFGGRWREHDLILGTKFERGWNLGSGTGLDGHA
jgi:hypothetical protein